MKTFVFFGFSLLAASADNLPTFPPFDGMSPLPSIGQAVPNPAPGLSNIPAPSDQGLGFNMALPNITSTAEGGPPPLQKREANLSTPPSTSNESTAQPQKRHADPESRSSEEVERRSSTAPTSLSSPPRIPARVRRSLFGGAEVDSSSVPSNNLSAVSPNDAPLTTTH